MNPESAACNISAFSLFENGLRLFPVGVQQLKKMRSNSVTPLLEICVMKECQHFTNYKGKN